MSDMISASTNKINFEYEFTSERGVISNKQKRDVPSILAVDALLTIKINNALYFEAELAILEFYKALFKWKEKIKNDVIPEFHYYTIEYDDYEDGAILSLLPFSDKARVKTIWAEAELYNVFGLDYVVSEFCELEQKLRIDIERFFHIRLDSFLKHIPYCNSESKLVWAY